MIKKYYFHDQSIVGLSLTQGVMHLEIECYDDNRETYVPVPVTFYGVQNLEIDHVLSSQIVPPYNEGEIIHFEVTGQIAKLIIEWINFEPKKVQTKLYEFSFDRMEISDAYKHNLN